MANQKLTEAGKKSLRNLLGYDDEQIEMFEKNPKQVEIWEKLPFMNSKKMVATCIRAENCGAHEIGDRYVFTGSGVMIKDETCERPCLWAMNNFLHFSYLVYDRAASGLDPSDMHFEYISCPDTGCKDGGFGKAMFRISVEDA